MEEVLMRDIIRDAIDSVVQLAADKQLQIEQVIKGPPVRLQADRDRIMQVIINLLSNAIKFCEAGKGQIVVQSECQGRWFVVSVKDNGHGIDPAYHELIFEKFYQTQDRNLRKPKGSGLGLAISRKILELHHGSIEVDSVPEKGSTFTFRIPLNQFERSEAIVEQKVE